jgi:hypothetical protein
VSGELFWADGEKTAFNGLLNNKLDPVFHINENRINQ